MGALVRAAMVAAAGCAVALGGEGVAAADPPREPSQLAQLVGADLGTLTEALPGVLCGNRLVAYNSPAIDSPTRCVNGAVDSGNSINSGNYHSDGDPINSGNFSNTNGSTGSDNMADSGNLMHGPGSEGL